MDKEYILKSVPNSPGIYLIKNLINNKCYIGQAIKLKKRLFDHINHFNADRYSHLTLYKAFKKYGIENFECNILYLVDFQYNGKEWLKTHLDELEKKFILEYDSYYHGYNSTLGGDKGVFGFKHSEETKQIISSNTKRQMLELHKNPEKWIKCKNWETNEIYISISISHLAKLLSIPRIYISRCVNGKQNNIFNKYTFARYNDSFPQLQKHKMFLFTNKELLNYIKEHPKCTYSEISKLYKLCKKTFYTYKNKLGLKFTQRIDTKVTREEFLEYFKNHTKNECITHFDISERTYYKYINKYNYGN